MAETEKVIIKSLCSWPLYFKRMNGVGDVHIPANADRFPLDVEEVRMQIQLGNKLFTGNDPSHPGNHARLLIVDETQRNELFGLTETESKETLMLTDEAVKALLAIRTKKEFNAQLEALVTTDAERKMIVPIAKRVGGDDVAAWKMEAINALAKTTAV